MVTWIISFIVSYLLVMSIYIGYCVNSRGLQIKFPQKIQTNYAKYLVEENDKFVDNMIEFETLLKTYKREFSNTELDVINKNVEAKNNIMIDLQKNPPDYTNKDYSEVYKDILKVYAFYIQGEVMRVEYISAYKNDYTMEEIKAGTDAKEEKYTMGIQLCNMMGSMVLEDPNIINKIKTTTVVSRHPAQPLSDWMGKFNEVLEKSQNLTTPAIDTKTPNDNKSTLIPKDTSKQKK